MDTAIDNAELPGDTLAERPISAEPVTEGDGGARAHLMEAWNHLAMFIGSADDEVEVGQAMALLAQMKILMSGMRVESPELEDPEADPNADPNAAKKPAATPRKPATQRADLSMYSVCYLCEDRAFGTREGLATHLKKLHRKV